MFNSFLSQLLIIFLLFVCCIRFIFTKKSKIDSAAVLAPAAFIISIFNILIWNASHFSCILAVLSFFVFLTNVRSLLRLSEKLFIDHYSGLFISATVIELLVTIVLAILIIFYRPVKLEPSKFNSTKTIQKLSGNCAYGLSVTDKADFKHKTTGILYTYAPDFTSGTPKGVVLFCGTHKSEVTDYEPYFLFLSQKGYTVCAADIYSSDCAYFSGIKNSKIFRKYFARLSSDKALTEIQQATFRHNWIESSKALTKLTLQLYGPETQIYYVTDSADYDSVYEVSESAGSGFTGFYSLNRIEEYKTPGLGFAEQTNISAARKAGLRRDKTLFIPRYAAGKTVAELKLLMEPEVKPLPPKPETETDNPEADTEVVQ